MKPNKAKRGSALAMVLVFMVIMMILGAGVLTVAQYSATQSAGAAVADKSYYSAESATQVAAQMLLDQLDKKELYVTRTGLSDTEVDGALIDMRDELEDKVEAERVRLSGIIDTEIKKLSFNDEEAALTEIEMPVTDSNVENTVKDVYQVIREYFTDPETGVVQSYDSYFVTYDVTLYLKDPIFKISTISGGRTVTAESGVTVSVILKEADVKPPLNIKAHDGGAFYEDKSGGIYSANSSDTYGMFCDGMRDLFADTDAMTDRSVIRATGSPTVLTGTVTAAQIRAAGSYVRVDGDAALEGDYSGLEYLEVTGDLTIRNTTNTPQLKGVYVKGNLSMGPTSGGVTRYTGYTGGGDANGTNFLVEGGSFIVYLKGSGSVINNSRFYVKGGHIEMSANNGGGNTNLTSNAIYAATAKAGDSRSGNITLGAGQNFSLLTPASGRAPQYYAEKGIKLYIHPSGGVYTGIFGTLGKDNMFTNSTGDDKLTGVFIGNCDSHMSYSIQKLSQSHNDYMLSGGIYDLINGERGTTSENGSIIIGVEGYEIEYTGLYLRETTGEE